METTATIQHQIEDAAHKGLAVDPLVSATDMDLEVLAAQLAHKPSYELARQVIAEMKARQWARSAA